MNNQNTGLRNDRLGQYQQNEEGYRSKPTMKDKLANKTRTMADKVHQKVYDKTTPKAAQGHGHHVPAAHQAAGYNQGLQQPGLQQGVQQQHVQHVQQPPLNDQYTQQQQQQQQQQIPQSSVPNQYNQQAGDRY